jgi:hypothetical protein
MSGSDPLLYGIYSLNYVHVVCLRKLIVSTNKFLRDVVVITNGSVELEIWKMMSCCLVT